MSRIKKPLPYKKWDQNDIQDQSGKVFIVTGANSGLGLYAAKGLAEKGATVVMAVRNEAKGEAAVQEILEEFPNAKLDLMILDLASFSSIKEFASKFNAKYSQLHGLLNNAGIMQPPYRQTEDGIELQMGVNHYGHYLLTGLLLEKIKATPGARVVNQSSFGHRTAGSINYETVSTGKGYNRSTVYGQSKLANLLFAYELQRKFEENNIDAVSVGVHPGYTATNLQSNGPSVGGRGFFYFFYKIGNLFAQSVEKGCLPLLYGAVGPEIEGADYIGPSGLGGFRGHPKRVKSNEASYDTVLATELWKSSEELTGLRYDF
jgi:NAD(P)-dependent dehydrogenase (short-subunit alcohol dehydrogenase family)